MKTVIFYLEDLPIYDKSLLYSIDKLLATSGYDVTTNLASTRDIVSKAHYEYYYNACDECELIVGYTTTFVINAMMHLNKHIFCIVVNNKILYYIYK